MPRLDTYFEPRTDSIYVKIILVRPFENVEHARFCNILRAIGYARQVPFHAHRIIHTRGTFYLHSAAKPPFCLRFIWTTIQHIG